MQNHDQVGNRARGDRTGHLLSPGRQKIAAALVLTSPFIPMLFQGEEWGASAPFLYFTDHQDEKLGEMVRQGRRREFAAHGWNEAEIPDPQARETFERCKLDWSEALQPARANLLDWHRRLIFLRQTEPALLDGRMDCLSMRYNEAESWLVIERGPIVVACNLAGEPKSVPLPAGHRRVVMASVPLEKLDSDTVFLPPDSVAVMRID